MSLLLSLLAVGVPWWAGLLIAHTIKVSMGICVFYQIRAGNLTALQFYAGTIAMKELFEILHLGVTRVYGFILAFPYYLLNIPIVSPFVTNARKQGGKSFG